MKKIFMIASFLLIASSLTACELGSEKTPETLDTVEYEKSDYIGMSVQKAQAKAKAAETSLRFVEIDGEPQAVTMDFRPGRINAVVKNGVIMSYAVEGAEEAVSYDQNSWKKIIDDSCLAYFDGCNNCRREAGSDIGACTRKACQNYEEPRCLDGEA